MNLKKSDKMIAIVGVVILVIAAIAIVIWSQNQEPEETPTPKEKLWEFTVDYKMPFPHGTGKIENPNTKVNDKIFKRKGDGSYQGNVTLVAPSGSNIKNATFKFYYKDKNYLLGRFGGDTLTITVTDEMRQEKTKQIIGEGTIYIDFPISNPLSFGKIMAKDEYEAKQRLEENLSDVENMKTFDVKVTLKQKESIFRPIAWILERLLDNDKFTLDVTFEYYVYEVVPPDDYQEDGGDKDTSLEDTSLGAWASTPYMSTNYLGYH